MACGFFESQILGGAQRLAFVLHLAEALFKRHRFAENPWFIGHPRAFPAVETGVACDL